MLKRINRLIKDVVRNGNEGIGKPEPLKHDFAGCWSRRITDEHRLVYKITDTEARTATCRYHYWSTPGMELGLERFKPAGSVHGDWQQQNGSPASVSACRTTSRTRLATTRWQDQDVHSGYDAAIDKPG